VRVVGRERDTVEDDLDEVGVDVGCCVGGGVVD